MSDEENTVPPDVVIEGRWEHNNKVLRRTSPIAPEGFELDTSENPEIEGFLREASRVLCIGAGGLGCDLLKCMALSGFRNIHVVDMDTIDATNLNRQFLFRASDVGNSKAAAAAAFINKRVAGANVTPFHGKMQDKDEEWYQQFHVVIAGLDSVPARRWINSTLVNSLAGGDDDTDLDTVIPLIDAGTEGFKGHVRVIFPGVTSCLDCTIELFPKTEKVPLCTIAATPRNAAHCVQYAGLIAWDEEKPFKDEHGEAVKYDTDNAEHMEWLYQTALKRAASVDPPIEGVTLKKTQGVIKNIIPAIASTNALASAAAVNEVSPQSDDVLLKCHSLITPLLQAFKLATNCAAYLENCMMYNGEEGAYIGVQQYLQNPDCTVCGQPKISFTVNPDLTLQGLFDRLVEDQKLQLKLPSATVPSGPLYLRGPKMIERKLRPNLDKALSELINSGDKIDVTDPMINGVSLTLTINFE